MLKKTAVLAMLLALLLSFSLQAMAQSENVKAYNLGVEAYRAKNYTEARQHWTRAVAQGIPAAYNNLGFLLFQGLGGDADAVRAVALWRDAATMGEAESQWHLASAYEEGKGTVHNKIEAYAWYRCAQAAYRAQATIDHDDATITRDIDASVARLRDAIPEARRKLAEDLAVIYITLYATAGANP